MFYLRKERRLVRCNDGRKISDFDRHRNALDALDTVVDDDVSAGSDDVVATGSRLVNRTVTVFGQVRTRFRAADSDRDLDEPVGLVSEVGGGSDDGKVEELGG